MKNLCSYILLVCFCLQSCGQKIKSADIMNQDNVQKVANIYKTVKIYDYNPQYKIHVTSIGFSFEILINDFPVQINYEPNKYIGTMLPINEALLKSGKQHLKIRMTPPIDEDYNMGKEIDFANSKLEIRINYGESGYQKTTGFFDVLEYEMPDMMQKLPYYEINLEFDAPVVAYEKDIKGWEESVDLSKEDKDKLQQEVEEFYKNIIKIYKSKDVNALAEKYYNRQKELAQVYFSNTINETPFIIDSWVENVNDNSPFIFNDYVMRFFGNGRIVQLAKTDKYYLNYSALIIKNSTTKDSFFYPTYLYRPKIHLHRPKAGGPLEVIR